MRKENENREKTNRINKFTKTHKLYSRRVLATKTTFYVLTLVNAKHTIAKTPNTKCQNGGQNIFTVHKIDKG